jgi:potassium-dependent mechanosensitive channel
VLPTLWFRNRWSWGRNKPRPALKAIDGKSAGKVVHAAEVKLGVRPLGSLRVISLHRQMIQRRTCRVLEFLAFLFRLNVLLSFFGRRDSFLASIGAALNANLAIGSFNITLGGIVAFLITVWASFLVSKFLRFVLEEDIYHHLRLAAGIPYAISTMLHYVILLIGFFVALGALGIDLTKVTILAGAFSVGIGFGLQNVINNFVSGLILLFERPIKVGDVIEVGGNVERSPASASEPASFAPRTLRKSSCRMDRLSLAK